MRILVVTHRFPYPADKGDRIRSFTWLEALGGRHSVDLLTFAEEDICGSDVEELISRTGISRVFPVRVNKIARAFYGLSSVISFKSVTEGYFYSSRFRQRLEELLRLNVYDVCLAICSSVGSYFLKVNPTCRTVVDFVDVDSYKWRLYGEYFSGLRGVFYRREAERLSELEQMLIGYSDDIVVISPTEASKIEYADVHIIGNPVRYDIERNSWLGNGNKKINRIVFVGQMDYFPNVDGVCWFAEEVWPKLKERYRELRFEIVGRAPSRKVRKLKSVEGIDVVGNVDSVEDYLRDCISVIPLRIACGLQNKLLESLSCGSAVVCSSGVAQAAGFESGEGVLVADSAREWVDSVSMLLEEPRFAFRLAREGREIVMRRFSRREIYSKMLQVVQGNVYEDESCKVALVC